MSIDVGQFHTVFFDESDEHLQEMERILLEIDVSAPDDEELNSIFRAAHSIKGGSGIFGFDALTRLTHVMENLLDQARKHLMPLTTESVDLLLSSTDVLKETLEAYKAGTDTPDDNISARIAELETVLGNGSQGENSSQASQPAASSESGDDGEGFDFGFFDDEDELPVVAESADETPSANTTDVAADAKASGQPDPLPAAVAVKPKVPAKASPAKENASIRVDTTKIDGLVNLVGELVITQSMLSMVGSEVDGQASDRLQHAITELQRNTREIQESVMSMRMLPVNMTFSRFPRVVRDLSKKLGKQVNLVMEGEHTEIDKSLIEKLVDPLTHLVRNSIDHGVESPEVRKAAGKPEAGTVTLSAEQKGGNIVIGITDDGAGLNRERILDKARQNGLLFSDDMPDSDVWNLIFEPGFSTAAEVTDVSGRGVGMDVVRRNIESIGGRIEIVSKTGEGSGFYIQLPLTLAILDGMCVKVGSRIFVIPLLNIIESFQPKPNDLKNIRNEKLLWIREQYWPMVALHQMMDIDDAVTSATQGIVVLVESSKKRYGIQVDSILGQQQVVIKSLERHYRKIPGLAGATIMGDGTVAMILDADAVAEHCQLPAEEELCV
ncbi:chemotaxis protein CheW [Alteromonas sp. 1_MG-2023]|uniref:chemotaxis protein CheA n=1 Tax=Alteromonas sp. 1_MG-2023 TaxID=3062669 RepID=UPI0026E1AF9C|nr:chemotaxis protein CheW [Alteromonas sp. 1_MG-2023]MDO6473922.1 chemotaxis protein CheW [Alteromonas sp. 1_MG-2023]